MGNHATRRITKLNPRAARSTTKLMTIVFGFPPWRIAWSN